MALMEKGELKREVNRCFGTKMEYIKSKGVCGLKLQALIISTDEFSVVHKGQYKVSFLHCFVGQEYNTIFSK